MLIKALAKQVSPDYLLGKGTQPNETTASGAGALASGAEVQFFSAGRIIVDFTL